MQAMLCRFSKTSRLARVLFASMIMASAASLVSAHDGSHGSAPARSTAPARRSPSPGIVGSSCDPPFVPPHGGQLSKTTGNYFEVVYGPQQTRIYVFDMFRAPKSARGIEGWATMQVRGNGSVFRFPTQYVAVAGEQDYVAVVADLTRIRDGDMVISYELSNVPNDFESAARFTQVFSMPSRPAAVTVVPLTDADRALVEQQRICPVMDAGLSEHGQPIKLMVAVAPASLAANRRTGIP
jgi:hypothetical protein